MKLLERAVASAEQRLLLVAPPERAIPDTFTFCDFDLERHTTRIRDVQRVRGSIYLADGAIDREDLTDDGLHRTPEDENTWHLALVNADGEVTACAWLREHLESVDFSRLRLRHAPIASAPRWREPLWRAVSDDILRTRREGIRYAEVGGWAVTPETRRTADPLLLALATYALARVCGDVVSITTATTRHGSCEILARIGGRPLEVGGETLPRYWDPRYRCEMEILRFDSRAPHPRFEPFVAQLAEKLAEVSVVARPYWPMMRDTRRPLSIVARPTALVLTDAVATAV